MMLILPRRKLLLAAPALILPYRRAEAQLGNHAQFPQTVQSTGSAAPVWVFKASGSGEAQSNTSTTSMNMTGADLIVVGARYAGSYTPVLTDSVGTNTYTFVTGFPLLLSSGNKFGVWYVHAPNVSSTMIVELSGGGVFGTIVAMGFSGSIASPQDQVASTTGWTTGPPGQVTPGLITPASPSELVVSVVEAGEVGSTYSLTGGFSAPVYVAGTASSDGVGMAYLAQTSAVAANPTWSMTNTVGSGGGCNVSFKS